MYLLKGICSSSVCVCVCHSLLILFLLLDVWIKYFIHIYNEIFVHPKLLLYNCIYNLLFVVLITKFTRVKLNFFLFTHQKLSFVTYFSLCSNKNTKKNLFFTNLVDKQIISIVSNKRKLSFLFYFFSLLFHYFCIQSVKIILFSFTLFFQLTFHRIN